MQKKIVLEMGYSHNKNLKYVAGNETVIEIQIQIVQL